MKQECPPSATLGTFTEGGEEEEEEEEKEEEEDTPPQIPASCTCK